MRAVLPHIAELRGEGAGELVLDGKVPLLRRRRSPVRIENLDWLFHEARQCEGFGAGYHRRSETIGDVPWRQQRALECRRPIFGQQLVGATALRVRRDAVSGA